MKTISRTSSALVFMLACTSFIISYNALQQLAHDTGIAPGYLSYLWPFVVDGALVVFSLSALRASMEGERVTIHMVLIGLFTTISIALNVLHAENALVSRLISGIAPAALFLSFEVFLQQMKRDAMKHNVTKNLHSLQNEISTLQSHRDSMQQSMQDESNIMQQDHDKVKRALQREIDALQSKRDKLQSQCNAVQDDVATNETITPVDERRERIVQLLAIAPGQSHATLAAELGVSSATISRDVKRLLEQGKLKQNGHGLEPIVSTLVLK